MDINVWSKIDLLEMLVKHGLPTSNLFEYAALTILKYEKIW